MSGETYSEADHPWSNAKTFRGEVFKYRKLYSKKIFRFSELPDSFKVLSQMGRSNIYRVIQMYENAKLLALYNCSADVAEAISKLSIRQQMDLMGPKAWEYVSAAYLTIEKSFVATLPIGKTLKNLDHVGVNISNGKRIISQCKKDPHPVPILDSFLNHVTNDSEAYYCAYGGVTEAKPGVEII